MNAQQWLESNGFSVNETNIGIVESYCESFEFSVSDLDPSDVTFISETINQVQFAA